MASRIFPIGFTIRSFSQVREDWLSLPYRKATNRRNMKSFLTSTFICIGLILCTQPVHAHRVPESLTTIERNPHSGTIEIIHRLHLHDAELALTEETPNNNLSLDSLKGRAKLALHVEQTFQLQDAETNERVTLTLVGAEIEGESILVFQEYAGEFPRFLKLRHDALRNFFPNQVNTVNVTFDSHTRTLIFDGNPKWKELK